MLKKGVVITLISILFLLAASMLVNANVVINEFLPNSVNSDYEWIELYNNGSFGVDLFDFNISENSASINFTMNPINIPARGLVVLVRNETVFNQTYNLMGITLAEYGVSVPSLMLNDAGDNIFLYNNSGELIDTISYIANPGENVSIGRYPDSSGNVVSLQTLTPGFQNDNAPPSFPSLAINNSNLKINQRVQISANCSDDTGLSMCLFSWNGTANGQWVNVSNMSVIGASSINYTVNLAVTLPAKSSIGYQFYANDSYNKFNNSALQTFTVADTPITSIIFNTNNISPKRYDVVNISTILSVTDADGLSYCTFTNNQTGTNASTTKPLTGTSDKCSDLVPITVSRDNTIRFWLLINDSSGNRYEGPGIVEAVVVNTPPQTPTILSPTNNLYTSAQPLNLQVIFPADADNDVINISYYINGKLNQTSLTNTTLNASDGHYKLNVSLSDGIGTSANASINFTIDTTLPSISELKSNDTDNVTRNNAVLNFTVTASDTNLFNVSLNGTLMNPIGGNQYRLQSNASDLGCTNEGSCLLAAKAIDLAGNSNSISYNLAIDNTPPVLSDLKAKNDTDNITRSGNVINFTVSFSDANINAANLNGSAMALGTNLFYLVATPSALGCSNGQCLLAATAADKADNRNTAVYNLLTDDLNPNADLVAPQNKANISGLFSLRVSVVDIIANISSVKAINGTAIYTMSLFSGTEGNGTYNLTIDSRTLPNGPANFRLNATDKAGNYNDTIELNVTIDNMPPKALGFNGIVAANATIARNATINVTASDNITGMKDMVFSFNGTSSLLFNSQRSGNEFAALLETRNFSDGVYNITAVPEDFAGNKEINHLLISEILFDPSNSDSGREWVEIYNPTNDAVDINNWDIRSKASTVTFNASIIVPPKTALIVADNSSNFSSAYGFMPDIDDTKHTSGFSFSNGNDFAQLRNPSNAVIDEVSWGNNADGNYNWSLFADSSYTITRNPASGDVNEQYDWQPNTTQTPRRLTNPNHITIKIDNTPPRIVSFNGNVVNGAFLKGANTINATITDALSPVNSAIFTVNGSGSGTLKLNALQEGNFWSAVLDTSLLADGKYNISVSANDSVNNINNTELIEVTIDNNPPIISNLAPANLSFVNSTLVFVSFALKDNTSGINISSGGVNLSYRFNGLGPVTVSLNTPVAIAGGYNFNATIDTFGADNITAIPGGKDNNGNIMPTPIWKFMIDLVKPTVTNIKINDTDNLLRSADVVNITLNSSNGVAGIKNVTIGSSVVLEMSNIYSTIWQAVAPASSFGCVAEGLCTLAISSEDNAGNVNNSESIKLTIDNTNPQAGNIVINNTIVSSTTPIKINLTVNDNNFALGTVSASNSSSISLSNATTAPYWIAETTASALGCQKNGACTIHLKAADSAGNINASEIAAISVDSNPPSIASAAINDSNNIVKSSDVINMSLAVSDSNTIISIKGNNANFSRTGSVWSAVNKSSDFCPSEGLCTVAFDVLDNLGNSNSSQSFAFAIDNTAPALSNIKINITNNISRQDSVVNFSITAADANNVSSLFLNFTPMLKLNDTVWQTVNRTSSLCGSNDGNCSLEFRATDNAGNIQALPLRIIVDSLNPQFSNAISSPSAKYNTTNVTLNATWSDPSGIAGVTFRHNATGSFQSYAGSLKDSYYILIIGTGMLRNQQVIAWNSSAFDIAGNLNDSMPLQTFKVENRAPAFTTIPNITAQEDTNVTLELSSFYSDPDSDNLTYLVAVQPENITVIINSTSGSVKLVPIDNLFGKRYIIFNATDNLTYTLGNNVTINFTNVNDAPVVSTIPDIIFNEDSYNDSIALDDFVSDVDTSDSQIAWTANSLSANVSIVITANRIMNVSAVGNYSGTSTALLTASDGSSSKLSNGFTITVNPVNDAPTTPVLSSPANNSLFSKTNVTLSWQASKDNESSTITYYIFNSKDTTPKANSSTISTSFIIENLTIGKTYYWTVLASDENLNSSLSEVRQYNITANLPPAITEFYPASTKVVMQENQSQKFNITKTDADNNIINVTWYVDGMLNATLTDTFNYATNISSAGLHNITSIVIDFFRANASASWLVNVTNLNQAPTLSVPEGQLNASENNQFIFNITGADFDNDVLAFAGNRSDVKITKFNYTAVINWTPTNNDVGISVIKFNVTDTGNLSDIKTVSINVSNLNDAPVITSFFPSENPVIPESNGEQLFNASAADADAGDTITITWRLNGIINRTGDSYKAGNLSAANYSVTANVTDGNLSVVKSWNMTVTAIPVTKKYVGPLFSLSKDQLENATNITINHTTLGNIDFKNNTLNLSGIVDIDNAINLSTGVTAINTEKYPQLNKSAKIVWKSLNFTKSPFIFFNSGFKAEGNALCPTDVCTNITYNKPTGILTFEVTHFSTYFAATNTSNDPPKITSVPPTAATLSDPFSYTVTVSDLDNATFIFTLPISPSGMSVSPAGAVSWIPNALGEFEVSVNVSDGLAHDVQSFNITVLEGARLRITDLDLKIDGKSSKNLRNNSIIRREAEPGSKVEFRIEVKNGFSTKDKMDIEDIETDVTIEGIDDGDDLEFEGSQFDLSPGRDKTVKAAFDIPLAVDEDSFDVIIKIEGEDQNGTMHAADWKLELEVNKDKHKLMLDEVSLVPEIISCGRNVQVSADVINIGQEEENEVHVEFKSEALELDKAEEDIFLDSGTEDISQTAAASFKVREDLAAGEYPIEIKAYRDNDRLEDTKTVNLKVNECVQEKKAAEREKVVAKPTQPAAASMIPADKLKLTAPSIQKPAAKESVKISFRETDEYTMLLIATVVTLTVGIFAIGGLVLMNMRR